MTDRLIVEKGDVSSAALKPACDGICQKSVNKDELGCKSSTITPRNVPRHKKQRSSDQQHESRPQSVDAGALDVETTVLRSLSESP